MTLVSKYVRSKASKQGWGRGMYQRESDPAAALMHSFATSRDWCKRQFKAFLAPEEVLGIPTCTRIYINPLYSVFGGTHHRDAQDEEDQQDAAVSTGLALSFSLIHISLSLTQYPSLPCLFLSISFCLRFTVK